MSAAFHNLPSPSYPQIGDMAELKSYTSRMVKDEAFMLPDPFVIDYMEHLLATDQHYGTDHAGNFIAQRGYAQVPPLTDDVEPAYYFASINDLASKLNRQALEFTYRKDIDRPVMYVVGGPGSGKSHLIATWDEADKKVNIVSEAAFIRHRDMNLFIVPLLGTTRDVTLIRIFCSPVLCAQAVVDRAIQAKDAGISADQRLFKGFKYGAYTPSLADAMNWVCARDMAIKIYHRTKEGLLEVESLEKLPQSWHEFIPEWQAYLVEVEADALTSEKLENVLADLKDRTFEKEGDLVTAVLELKLAYCEAQGKDVAWARTALQL